MCVSGLLGATLRYIDKQKERAPGGARRKG
jgi:hypothetical protein